MLAWGTMMGLDEVRARDAVERALGDAVAAGDLVPGAAAGGPNPPPSPKPS